MREADRVRISVHLIDAPSDSHLWAQDYERPYQHVLMLQRDVASAITQEIRVSLTPDEQVQLASYRAVDPKAHDLYLRGRFELHRCEIDGPNDTDNLFDEAIAVDPTYRLYESPQFAIDEYPIAVLKAGMGDAEGALDSLENALAQHSPNMIYLRVEPFLGPVRHNPRYRALQDELMLR